SGVAPKNPSRANLGRAMTIRTEGQARMFLPRIVAARNASVVVVLDEGTDVARLDEARTEFIGAAALEVRTPPTTRRRTLAWLYAAEAKLTPRQRETPVTARLGCEQLATTVDAFLDVTRAETGALVLARDRVDIRALVDQVAGSLRARFEDRKIALDVDAPPAVVLTCDRARLSAALSNLLTN